MMGISMLGKMSTGIRSAASAPRTKINRATTTKVYGRLSAILTMASMSTKDSRPAERGHFGLVSIETWVKDLDISARRERRTITPMRSVRDIVIYEEDSLTRALLEEWLGEEGYRVRVGNRCNPGADAPCDLVILSVFMPKHGGAQCVRGIREAHPGTPLIAISGQFRTGLAAAGATAHMLDVQQVVAKPIMRKELLESVRGIMRG